jgi:hypothetical protein
MIESNPPENPRSKDHNVIKAIAGFIAAITIVGYVAFNKEVNNFAGKVLNGENPFPTAEPTKNPDEYIIPEGLGVEDKHVRQNVKKMMKNTFSFGLSEIEVKKYLKTGETKDCKSFEVLNDANDKPAFVVVKSGNNGFDEDKLVFIKNGINRLNELEPTMLRTLVDKFDLGFVSVDINNQDFFGTNKTWAGSYLQQPYGGVILYNQNFLINEGEKGIEYCNFECLKTVIMESRALYTSDVKYLKNNDFTTAPDRLNDKIGIDKALFFKNLLDSWYADKKITYFEYITGKNGYNTVISYYKDKGN